MSVLTIALKDLLVTVRDRTALVMLLATPILMIAVLGSALGPVFEGRGRLEPATLAVVESADPGGPPLPSVAALLGRADLGGYLTLARYPSEAEALADLSRGAVAAVLVVPPDFGPALVAGRPVELRLVKDPGREVGAAIAATAVRGLVDGLNASRVAAMVVARAGGRDPGRLMAPGPGWPKVEIAIRQRALAEDGRTPTAMEYYAVAMAGVYLLFAANRGARQLLEEREEGTLARLMAHPVRPWAILAGKAAGMAAVGMLQLAALFAVSHFAYGVGFGRSWPGLALMMVSSVFAATGLGALIAAAGRRPETADQLGVIVILVMSLIGGSMLPFELFPDWLDRLSHLTFNRWSMRGFFALMLEGGGLADVLLPAGVLAAMGLGFLAAAAPMLRREGG